MPAQPRSSDAYPFEHTRPLEAYRLHYAMDLPAFTELLGLSEEVYREIVAGTCDRGEPPQNPARGLIDRPRRL